jgi:hypothetical protein
MFFEGGIGVGAQLSTQGGSLLRWDGGGGTTTIGNRCQTACRRLPHEVAAHRALVDGEPASDFGATEAALHRSDNPLA